LDKVKIVRRNQIDFQKAIDKLKRGQNTFDCGAIACFIGIVRLLGKDGSKVQQLVYEAYEKEALKVLRKIRAEVLKKNRRVKDLLIYHVIDRLRPGDETLFVAAIGKHRQDSLNAVSQAIEEIKSKPPIWKKEFTEKGAYWTTEFKGSQR
jgi:molybdopterin synthase catalytic subunit